MEQAWTDDYSVGNAWIDADHKMLLAMVNGVVHAVEMKDCRFMSQAFGQLDNRLRAHFVNEEIVAQSVKFPFAKNKLAHHYLLKELELLKNELEARDCELCEEAIKHYSDSLLGLLIDHIVGRDMLMKPVLQSYPYNFIPAGM